MLNLNNFIQNTVSINTFSTAGTLLIMRLLRMPLYITSNIKNKFWKLQHLVTSLPWRSLWAKLVDKCCIWPNKNAKIKKCPYIYIYIYIYGCLRFKDGVVGDTFYILLHDWQALKLKLVLLTMKEWNTELWCKS